MKTEKRKVILVTDGDKICKDALELIAQKIGGRCISLSSGNPTPLSGEAILNLIKLTPSEPVLVMLDDKGNCHQGAGERALEFLVKCSEIKILGVLAVASNTVKTKGIKPNFSITKRGEFIEQAVDKQGYPKMINPEIIQGDTVDILNSLKVNCIVGIGDIGKMDGADSIEQGCPITRKAIEKIIHLSS